MNRAEAFENVDRQILIGTEIGVLTAIDGDYGEVQFPGYRRTMRHPLANLKPLTETNLRLAIDDAEWLRLHRERWTAHR